MTCHLIVVPGLPGVGKTSIATIVAGRVGAVHLSIDAVEDAILACGLPSGRQVGVAAYEAVRSMAELNLRLGRDVVVDAVIARRRFTVRRLRAARTRSCPVLRRR